VSETRLVHHELCFGCGRTNLFGLLMDVERTGDGRVRGRGFVKQDHQGPVPGVAHPGVVAAALSEAMAFAADGELESLEMQLHASVPVGAFIEVEAHVADRALTAAARVDGKEVASARGANRD
jgi:acyl-coenzyme A thioesterase PaaI-like protein